MTPIFGFGGQGGEAFLRDRFLRSRETRNRALNELSVVLHKHSSQAIILKTTKSRKAYLGIKAMEKTTSSAVEKLAAKKAKLEAKLSEIERKEKVERSKDRAKKRKSETQAKIIFAGLLQTRDVAMRRMITREFQAMSRNGTATERQRADLEKLMASDFYLSMLEGA